MRRFLLLPVLLGLIAASPASDQALQMMNRGEEQQAFALIERASGGGDRDAIDYLAWFYDTGRVVVRDEARAATLYRRAAEAGQRHAQWRLGVMLDTGTGVPENPAEAFLWIRRAADQNSPAAFTSLGVMYANGRGVPVDYALSMRWYLTAVRARQAHGFYGVGVLHTFGQGVPEDRQEGLAWMLCAATMGDETAAGFVERYHLSSEGTTAAAARANAIFHEYGLDDYHVQFRDFDAERAVPTT
jgi:uncharacterized protein